MPDGKRNSIPSEDETDGVNCYYDDELQNATGLRRKIPLPLNHNTRGFNNINDRRLKTMVANEIKKTLDGEDNKKLVAHHLPVLHSDSEPNESEMIVVGVVLNSKQSQNEEVTRAIDMLRRNGVSCVCFKLKDSLQNGDKKDDKIIPPCENSNSSSTEELLKSLMTQQISENSPLQQKELSPTHKKVSSPTVSTTSDYASPHPTDSSKDDDEIRTGETLDSCTSTTAPVLTAAIVEQGSSQIESSAVPLLSYKSRKTAQRKGARRTTTESEEIPPPTLSPTPPVLFPQIPDSHKEQTKDDEFRDGEVQAVVINAVKAKPKVGADSTALRRKKRRKRMYPYVSRRKSKSKRVKQSLSTLSPSKTINNTEPPHIKPLASTISMQLPESPIANTANTNLTKEIDPYEFEDSDNDAAKYDTFKTPSGRKVSINCVSSRKKGPSKMYPKKDAKRSPRKRLTFSKTRAFSPDITDHITSTTRRQRGVIEEQVNVNLESMCNTLESCVQPISTSSVKDTVVELPTLNVKQDYVKLVLPVKKANDQRGFVLLPRCDDINQADNTSDSDKQCDMNGKSSALATHEPHLQTKNNLQISQMGKKHSPNEFLVPAPPDDSLLDAPDSMQLRRSSFYSSISRNVRTNLEKYLDGRPQDLKPVKRSKKIKNGFLLHHGDNFPDDPEAPYRLHLATQVLLKLNKRRVKCKPKEDKGKSLLSYLKLQPKRVSRVGKNSKVSSEENEESCAKEHTSVFSGEWTVPRKFICNICGQVENDFWDMVMHKGEVHPGIVVTHVELSDDPPEGFRLPPSPRNVSTLLNPPPCTKCSATFGSYSELHRHIFECAGNTSVLEEDTNQKVQVTTRKKKSKRKRGFKRRISGLPKKNSNASKNSSTGPSKSGEITKRRNSEVFKCEFCTREFKTEGWLKNHVSLSHSLPISIPLNKLSLPSRASIYSSRRFTAQVAKPTKQLCRES